MHKITAWFKRHPWLIAVLQIGLVALAFGLLVQNLLENWNTLRSYPWSIRPGLVLPGLLLLVAGLCILPGVYRRILDGFGYPFRYPQVFEGFFIAHLSKYLPGGIWVVPGRAVVFQQMGVNVVTTSLGYLLEHFVLILAGVLVFLPYLFFASATHLDPTLLVIAAAALLGIFVFLSSRSANRLLSWGLKKLGYQPDNLNISMRVIAPILLIDILHWLVVGSGFFLLCASFYPLSWRNLLPFAGVFSLSWVAGFVAFITPSGLGVREGAMVLLLAPFLPAPFPAIIALAARLWWTLGDLITFGMAVVLKSRRKAD